MSGDLSSDVSKDIIVYMFHLECFIIQYCDYNGVL